MATEVKKSRVFKEFKYKGYSMEELLSMSIIEFSKIITSKSRRHLQRGITVEEKDLIDKVLIYQETYRKTGEKPTNSIKTKERSMIILPCMVGCVIAIHRGNGYFEVSIKEEMLAKKLSAFVTTKNHPSHARNGFGVVSSGKIPVIK